MARFAHHSAASTELYGLNPGHLWSLAVEEQFYMLWPFLLTMFWRRRVSLAVAGIILGPVSRVALYFIMGHPGDRVGSYFPCVSDTIAMGCLLAFLQPRLDLIGHKFSGRWFAIVPLTAIAIPSIAPLSAAFYQVVGITLMNACIALSIHNAIRMRYRVFNLAPIIWIGQISYSLYLWQQPFLNRHSVSWFAIFPTNILIAALIATMSHYCIEKPFLKLRNRVVTRVRGETPMVEA